MKRLTEMSTTPGSLAISIDHCLALSNDQVSAVHIILAKAGLPGAFFDGIRSRPIFRFIQDLEDSVTGLVIPWTGLACAYEGGLMQHLRFLDNSLALDEVG